MTALAARAVAYYLPQYHPIPENDDWWGPGFTEWTNVTKAKPLYPKHFQPHLPADLGFYDLRLPQAREAQAELAAAHGIEAFCYWHYWFGSGVRLLQAPFESVLASGRPNLSFCLGWANETWTGIWHGDRNRILIRQEYPGVEDYRAHFATLLRAFCDARYMTVAGQPVFHVYRPENLPNAREFVDIWQQMARKAGIPGLYLVAGLSSRYSAFREDGFDAGVYQRLPFILRRRDDVITRTRHKILRQPVVRRYATTPLPWPADWDRDHRVQPCIVPNWDNTPRSGRNGIVLTGATPEAFRVHVRDAVDILARRQEQERLLWIKSWNEWAEGNYLEPDQEYGRSRLEVLRAELAPKGLDKAP